MFSWFITQNSRSSLHIFVHHCTFRASLHVKASPRQIHGQIRQGSHPVGYRFWSVSNEEILGNNKLIPASMPNIWIRHCPYLFIYKLFITVLPRSHPIVFYHIMPI